MVPKYGFQWIWKNCSLKPSHGTIPSHKIEVIQFDLIHPADFAKKKILLETFSRPLFRHLKVIKMNTEAWGILLGHATGFAATKACSQLQQAVPRNFFCVALMPLVSFGWLGAWREEKRWILWVWIYGVASLLTGSDIIYIYIYI